MKIFTSGDAFKIDEILIKKIKEKEILLKNKYAQNDTKLTNENSQFQSRKKTVSEPKKDLKISMKNNKQTNQINTIKIELEDFEEDDDDTLKALNREHVCNFLQEKITDSKESSINLIRIYLQFCVYIWNDSNPYLNNLLIDTYKSFIEKLSTSISTQIQTVNTPATFKKMLNYFLNETNKYEPSYALSKLDLDNYAEERAIVLGN